METALSWDFRFDLTLDALYIQCAPEGSELFRRFRRTIFQLGGPRGSAPQHTTELRESNAFLHNAASLSSFFCRSFLSRATSFGPNSSVSRSAQALSRFSRRGISRRLCAYSSGQ